MKKFPLTLCLLLLLTAGTALAQQPQQRPQSAEGTAPAAQRNALSPNDFINAGLQAAQWIDAGRVGDLWEGASPLTKSSVAREAFVAGIAKVRQPLGTVVSRNWVSLHRQQGDASGPLPPGQYVGIGMATVFAANTVAHERVTLHLDEDGIWRFTGYVLE
ncbi:DUF4019 domain-containing protein [Lysobacter sp. A421]